MPVAVPTTPEPMMATVIVRSQRPCGSSFPPLPVGRRHLPSRPAGQRSGAMPLVYVSAGSSSADKSSDELFELGSGEDVASGLSFSGASGRYIHRTVWAGPGGGIHEKD